MQRATELYREIYAEQNYYVETSLVIGESGVLLDEHGNTLIFGEDEITQTPDIAIRVASNGGDGGFLDDMLLSVKTTRRLFSEDKPAVGCVTAGEIYVEMLMPLGEIPPMAVISPYIRLVSRTDGRRSEWVQKGVFYIDERSNTENDDNLDILRIHGYDAILKTGADYVPSTDMAFPAKDIDVVYDIAKQINVRVDTEYVNTTVFNKQYDIQYPVGYSMREMLSFIGNAYAGNWLINDNGYLTFVQLNGLPKETSILSDENGFRLLWGDGEGECYISVVRLEDEEV